MFIPKLDESGRGTTYESLCMECAQEMGLNMMEQLNIDPEQLQKLEESMPPEIREMFGNMMNPPDGMLPAPLEGDDDDEAMGTAPSIDFGKVFGGMFIQGGSFGMQGQNLPALPPQKPKKKGKNSKATVEDPLKGRKFLTQFCLDLTKKAREGKIDAVIGREREMTRLMQVLCRRQKNNPCLIGEPGVGKTAVAEALAQKIVDGDVPFRLSDKEVMLVDMTSLVAGTQFRGQFEQRIKGLIDEARTLGNIILVIDEVHSIVGAGDAEGGMNAANILKPALSRGEVQIIGATTLTEYRKYIEKDSALERRFQPIMIDEPSVEDSIAILLGIKKYYEQHSKIRIPEEVVSKAVLLSERYITDRFLPDKAIDLIDEAAAHLSMTTVCLNDFAKLAGELLVKRERIAALEQSLAEGGHDESTLPDTYKAIAELKSQELNEQAQLDDLQEECDLVTLTIEDLARVVETWTGVPAASITEHEYVRLEGLPERLRGRIVGQDEAVEAVVRAILRNRAQISPKRKPVSFIFDGPTGVGKTELVRVLANDMFNSTEALIRLDMSEYMEKHAVSRMVGAPPGYVGYDDAGQLTEKIRRKPYSVILFDEIEKAHPDVLNILLQILDNGRITDAGGRVVNFENTVIVMTTNAGANLSSTTAGFADEDKRHVETRTDKALKSFLRPEFINRVDEVITFRALSREDFASIATIMLDDLKRSLAESGVTLAYTAEAAELVGRESFDPKYGARNMRRYVQRNIEDKIAAMIISNYADRPEFVSVVVEDGALVVNR